MAYLERIRDNVFAFQKDYQNRQVIEIPDQHQNEQHNQQHIERQLEALQRATAVKVRTQALHVSNRRARNIQSDIEYLDS